MPLQCKKYHPRNGDLLRATNNDARSGGLQTAMRTEGAQHCIVKIFATLKSNEMCVKIFYIKTQQQI